MFYIIFIFSGKSHETYKKYYKKCTCICDLSLCFLLSLFREPQNKTTKHENVEILTFSDDDIYCLSHSWKFLWVFYRKFLPGEVDMGMNIIIHVCVFRVVDVEQ